MHQNSSPYTNDDKNSDKENIPPTYSYPMPSNTRSAKRRALNRTSLQEISPSPDPNDIVVTTSPELTPEPISKALIKRTGNCPICQLPYVYNHIAWCRGLTNGYTHRCHKKTPPPEPETPKNNTTPTKTPLSLTTIQQLDEFYPDKASYLSFWKKVINKPSFTTFDYAYHSHWSLKHQIQMTKELLSSLKTMDETHITAVEASLLRMCQGPLGDKIFSKTTTIQENGFEKPLPLTYMMSTPHRSEGILTPKGKSPS